MGSEGQLPDGVLIRPPCAGDGEGLARAWLDAGAHYARRSPALFQYPDPDGLAPWLERRALAVAAREDRCYFVAERERAVAGFVTAHLERPLHEAARQFLRDAGQTRATVDALVVAERYRRRGVGTRLLGAVEAWARGQGAAVVLLDTSGHSELSVPFYEERMGYERVEVRFRKALTRRGTATGEGGDDGRD